MPTATSGFVALLLALLCAKSLGDRSTPLAPLSGDGAIGSPGGTHPIAFDGDTAHVVWGQGGDIHYRRSTDAGATWGHTVRLTSAGTAQYPCSLEFTGSVLHLIWPDSRHGTWEVFHKQSVDGGGTWSEDTRLTPGVDLFRMATAASGATVHVTWASRSLVVPTPAGTHTWGEIYYKRSTDGGATWGPDVRLTMPDGSAMRPGIAAVGDDVYLIWFDQRDRTELLDWRIYVKHSADGGATWGPDVELHKAPGRFPHHPQIVAAPTGRVCAIWEEGQVFDGANWSGDPALHACVSDDKGQTWSKLRRITFVNAPNGWATHAKSHACGSRIDLAWTDAPEGAHGPRAAYYMASPDGGLTWGEPVRLTSAADGDCAPESVGGGESAVVVAIARSGRLYHRQCAPEPIRD
ncbi:MAG: exo-alpha-sialidase [Armatimonadetes bacterium]|nr:exo-alpha-sialidase [Armatimonadota bacterium]